MSKYLDSLVILVSADAAKSKNRSMRPKLCMQIYRILNQEYCTGNYCTDCMFVSSPAEYLGVERLKGDFDEHIIAKSN